MPSKIPAGVSNTGMNYFSKKSITLNASMSIKDISKSHPSDHYMLTPSAINNLEKNDSTIEVYRPMLR